MAQGGKDFIFNQLGYLSLLVMLHHENIPNYNEYIRANAATQMALMYFS